MWISIYLAMFGVCAAFYAWQRRRSNPHRRPLPPGPKRWPFLSNIFQVPDPRDWKAHRRLSEKYGPIVYYERFGKSTILISSHELAVEFFERRGQNYSDRSHNIVMGAELVGWNRAISLHPSGPRHSYYRKLLNNAVNPSAVRSLQATQEQSAHRLLSRLLQTPDEWYHGVRSAISETLVQICFGRVCSTDEFPYITMAERSHQVFNSVAVANAWAVDYLPFLKHLPEWLPGMGFKRLAKAWRAELDEFVYGPYNIVEADVNRGTAQPSYVASLINAHGGTPNDEERDAIAWSSVSFFTGGIDTTIAAVTTFIMLMCLHPEVQHHVYEEMLAVVGRERLPTLEDRAHLPYLSACIQEMFRMYPIVPLGVAKRANKDDYYGDYYIPADTTVVPNIWGMSHDPNIYESPESFIPERFLDPALGRSKPGFRSTRAFGFGRRVCPGRHLAEEMVFIHTACTVAAFELSISRGQSGNANDSWEVEFVEGLITMPKPFTCTITPRMSGLAECLAHEAGLDGRPRSAG
ncbi:cytochrome P450 [Trametopsis cervina]|nr:cytochrome P450 [Trametopsis cervina]